jgi:hypothetical protein
MFDATLFLSRRGINDTTTVKAHDCRMKLVGRPAESTLEGLTALAVEQIGTVKVNEPKVELPTGQTFQPRCELSGEHAGLFISGVDPDAETAKSNGRKGTGKNASKAHAEEVTNGQA